MGASLVAQSVKNLPAGDLGSISGSRRSPGEGIGYSFQYSWASLVAQIVRNPPAMQETWVWSMSWEDSPGGGHGNPLLYSCLENPHGQRSLVGCSPWGHKELDTTEWLSTTQHSTRHWWKQHSCVLCCIQSRPTLCNRLDYSLPGPIEYAISRTRILEWCAISYYKGSSWPRDPTCVSWVSCCCCC